MSKIKVRLVKRGVTNVKLKPKNGIKVKDDTTYLYDPTLIADFVDLAEDWATKIDGKVEEDGEQIDYSAKAYAIGGTGTETNNAKYFAEQASDSATSASNSATTATTQAGIATTQAGIATTKAGQAATSEYNAEQYSISASNSATSATNSATSAYSSEVNAASSASTATSQASIATTQAGLASGYATSASGSASSASTSATNAQTWAEGTDVQVSALGGEHSSKGWADIAKYWAESIGTVLHYKGSVATYDDLPTSGNVIGDVWNVLDDGSNYAWDGTGWDSFGSVVDLSPYRTSADQDIIDATKVPTSRTVNGKALSSDISLTYSDVGAVASNASITGATKCKITYDSKGLVTAGADLGSSDITTALGYTPYDSSNPSGYTSNIGTVTKVNNTSPDSSGNVSLTIPTINSSNNYVPYRSGASSFGNSTLMYNSNAMAFTGRLHVGSSSPASYYNKGKFTIYDNTPSQQVSSLALLNYGGGGGCGVAIDMYNTSANGGIPSGRFGVIDNGNYSGYLQLQVKKSGAQSNPLLPAMNIVPVPATNSLTTCVSFGQDEFNRVLFDLHKPESTVTITDSDKRWGGSGTTYRVTGNNKFNTRLLVAVGDIVSFDSFATEATVTGVVSNSTTCQITTNISLGTISNKNISVKKAYFKITDENNNIKVYVNPYGRFGIGTGTPAYDLDVAGNINASTDIKINGSSVALDSDIPTNNNQLTNGAGYITSSALTGYATETWVGNQGYITGITSSDVTTALGYTPYDASNPNGYTSNTGTVTSVNNVSPVNGNVSLSIPTVNNPTITITQGGVTKGSFTLNQSTGDTIELDAGGGNVNTFKLFHHDWFDYQLNDMAWLRADTFSWQDGTVYSNAYNHLVADYNGGTSQTETVGSYTITYVLATDGHKITTDETTVANIYNESGVAWYYILDTTNQRFKLPRTKYGFVGLRDAVGKYVPESLPNITGYVGYSVYAPNGAFYGLNQNGNAYSGGGYPFFDKYIDASRSSPAYQNNAPVQQRATQMYLYFYVGQFSQSATEQTAGLNSELFNGKLDLNGNNATFAHIVETYSNGTSWYRIWSDGWCEQGGLIERPVSNYTTTITLLKAYRDTNWEYSDSMQLYSATGGAWNVEHESSAITAKTINSFSRVCGNGASYSWQAKGYIS